MTIFKGKLTPVLDRVIVTGMHFGEQKTASGIIIRDDDGTTRGIYPRWAKVHAKGNKNVDEYQIGDWVLVEHGRWTRGVKIDEGTGSPIEVRMVEAESILGWQSEDPSNDIRIGEEIDTTPGVQHRPEDFINESRKI
jgi:co-chaperonin GroES (HSP10)